jgi:hypothetical protein
MPSKSEIPQALSASAAVGLLGQQTSFFRRGARSTRVAVRAECHRIGNIRGGRLRADRVVPAFTIRTHRGGSVGSIPPQVGIFGARGESDSISVHN